MRLARIDPLFQFLGAGAVLFTLSALVRPYGSDDQTIHVSRAVLEQYLASGGGETLASVARTHGGTPSLAALSDGERRELVRKYVQEQALYREAREWGMDENDLVIRRRLGQSLRFALRPAAEADPGDAVLRKFYVRHRENYRSRAETSFDHIFFSVAKRGKIGALSAARRAGSSPVADWRAEGDRFAYQRSYVDAGPGMIQSQLGDGFEAKLRKLPVAADRWQGPIASASGFHLVRINRRLPAKTSSFEEVRLAVLDDWRRAIQDSELDQAVNAIVDQYDVDEASDVGDL
ncbi:peptidyl-prolyl cis-trans isomerase [Novosphingobium malaysiense]|uniref:peptidylprolyl isomerase n=1 Tax=Novosphingobium malaysiense TaxID=1348853 RepID=A0A0B1ZV61_9SPHN|nr:peptidylprolyl isomerase [Novosphingobium malaysiense]KHK93048.1 hypothetical protein LK12_01365 [Novosphingobium malaysiense]